MSKLAILAGVVLTLATGLGHGTAAASDCAPSPRPPGTGDLPQVDDFVVDFNPTIDYLFELESEFGCTFDYVRCRTIDAVLGNPYNPVPEVDGFVIDATGTVHWIGWAAGSRPPRRCGVYL